MTTNQTIDGVPRDDLELFMVYGTLTDESRAAGDRLRALLDAKAEDAYHACSTHGDNVEGVCGACESPRTQGEPVAGITLQQVLKAYDYATSHPHGYLRGTTNWCAAVAYSLNAEQPAPVAVAMPERLQQVLKFLEGAENLDGHWFGEPGPTGQIYWWRNELRKALAETNLFANQQ